MEKKDYAIGGITVLFLMSLGINIVDDATHYCEDRATTYHCDSLSKYYSLDNGKCVNNLMPNKVCRTGWEEIGVDEDPAVPPGQGDYLCSPNPNYGCVSIE